MIKKILSLIIVAFLFTSVCACNSGSSTNVDLSKVEVWTKNSSQHVLKDKNYNDDFKEPLKISILAGKNERESTQLIITPQIDIKNYYVELENLTDIQGHILDKSNFSLFNQKYVNVTSGSQGYSSGVGLYPDALLPMDKAISYKENSIQKGFNQGITIIFEIPAKQESGKYYGDFNLIIDGKSMSIPVEVEIVDYTLTDDVSAKSCFLLSRHYMQYSSDSSMENYKNYYDYLLAHRVMPMYLPALQWDIPAYTQCAYDYGKRNDVSSYAIPYKEKYNNSVKDTDIDWDFLYDMTYSLAKKSVETGINIIKKSYYYFGLIDEARLAGLEDRAIRICNDTYKLILKLSKDFNNDSQIQGDNKAEIVESIKNIPCLETNEYSDKLYNGGEGVKNWCPMFDYFNTSENRDVYKNLGYETWWYGCIGPSNPYPTYHIDDDLWNSRILSWMQKDYGISGNLYWETIFWTYYRDNIRHKTDLYDGDPMRFPGVNGDGWLLYPGDVYGIEGPVGSVRLESITDGLEEYEMLQGIENQYKDVGVSSTDILQYFYNQLYTGTMVISDASNFLTVRKNMYQTASLSQNYKIYISELSKDKNNIVFEMYVDNDTTLVCKDAVLQNKEVKNFKVYTVKVSLDNTNNYLNFNAERDGKTQSFVFDLGERQIVINDFNNQNNITEFTSENASLSLVQSEVLAGKFEGGVLKVEFNKSNDKNQSIKFVNSNLSLLSSVSNMSFDVFVDKKTELSVYVSVENKPVLVPLGGVTLSSGYKNIVISNLNKIDWNSNGKVNYVLFVFGNKGDESRIIYLDNICLKGGVS